LFCLNITKLIMEIQIKMDIKKTIMQKN